MEEFRGEMIWIGASGERQVLLGFQICVLGKRKRSMYSSIKFHRLTLISHVALYKWKLFLLCWNFLYYFPTIPYPL